MAQLLEVTINNLWQEFKKVERPFLIGNPLRAEQVRKGDYWGQSDIDEKAQTRQGAKNRDRVDMAEAGFPQTQQRYHRTDLAHRFIWYAFSF